jgi:DUF2934 family protein
MAGAAQTAPDPASQPQVATYDTEVKAKVPADPGNVTQPGHDPQRVAQLAYFHWEARGCPSGSAEEDWFRAERELYGDSRVTET